MIKTTIRRLTMSKINLKAPTKEASRFKSMNEVPAEDQLPIFTSEEEEIDFRDILRKEIKIVIKNDTANHVDSPLMAKDFCDRLQRHWDKGAPCSISSQQNPADPTREDSRKKWIESVEFLDNIQKYIANK